jgi:transcriptional regulator
MYTREHFSLPSLEAECAFVRERSFGVLATADAGEVFTSPLPVDLRGGEGGEPLFVAGHVARANRMATTFAAGGPATITVLGPDTYVPAEWFGVRNRIPTWLYASVEVSGRVELSDPARTRADVELLIERLQRETVPGSTWTLAEMPQTLVETFLQNIVGFRLHDLRLTSCFRLNQRKAHSGHLAEALSAGDVAARHALARLVLDPPTIPPG